MAPFRPPPQSSIDVHEGLLNAVSQVAQFTSGMRNVPFRPPGCPVYLGNEECPRSAPPRKISKAGEGCTIRVSMGDLR